jgi:hypothetical protein
MPLVGIEPTTLEFERANEVLVLDRAASAVGLLILYNCKLKQNGFWVKQNNCSTLDK